MSISRTLALTFSFVVFLGVHAGAADSPRALFDRGVASEKQGTAGDAVDYYHRALVLDPEFGEALANLAWIKATSKDRSVRDPKEAVRLAARLVDLTVWKERPSRGTWTREFRIQSLYVLTVAFIVAGNERQAMPHAQQVLEVATRYDELAKSRLSSEMQKVASDLYSALKAGSPRSSLAALTANNTARMSSSTGGPDFASPASRPEGANLDVGPSLNVGRHEFVRLDVPSKRR